MNKMTTFLWFDGNIAEAMDLYRSVLPGSKVLSTTPGPNGALMSATFELDGQRFIAFNGARTSSSRPRYRCTSTARPRPRWTSSGPG